MQSQFTSDKYFEEMIARFLDSNFYRYRFPEKEYIIARVQNKNLQKMGIDVALINTINKSVTYIDEKCAAHYINSKLETFALEITGTDGNPGWLLKDGMVTDFYLFIWVHADEAKFPLQEHGWNRYYETAQIEDIDYVTCCLIRKETLINYLNNQDLGADKLYEQAEGMRRRKCKSEIMNGFLFTYSYKNLREGPVNILIPKETLQTLATNEQGHSWCFRIDAPCGEENITLMEYNG